jgi:CRISPR system Cascade subunit CasE
MSLYFSRLTLNRYAPTRALSGLLDPSDENARADAHHRLIWTLFGDGADRTRDFLWRADGRGQFFTLSARPPLANDLFSPPEVKEFAPDLRKGDRLHFALRANATRDQAALSRLSADQRRGKSRRVDLVMDLLRTVPKGERAPVRMAKAQEAGSAWMQRQGAAKGFAPVEVAVEDYRVLRVPRGAGGKGRGATHGVMDLAGVIEVTDPALLLPALAGGFGRAKAWGCGLMLIRRAR